MYPNHLASSGRLRAAQDAGAAQGVHATGQARGAPGRDSGGLRHKVHRAAQPGLLGAALLSDRRLCIRVEVLCRGDCQASASLGEVTHVFWRQQARGFQPQAWHRVACCRLALADAVNSCTHAPSEHATWSSRLHNQVSGIQERAGTCSGRRSVGCALSWQLLSSLAGVPVLSCASLAMAERPVVLQAAGGVGRRPQHGLADRTGMAPVQSCTAGHHVCLSKQRHTPWACTAALRCVGELSSATHAALLHRQRDEPILVCVCCLRNGPYICCCQLQPGRWLSASAQPG